MRIGARLQGYLIKPRFGPRTGRISTVICLWKQTRATPSHGASLLIPFKVFAVSQVLSVVLRPCDIPCCVFQPTRSLHVHIHYCITWKRTSTGPPTVHYNYFPASLLVWICFEIVRNSVFEHWARLCKYRVFPDVNPEHQFALRGSVESILTWSVDII